MREYRQLGGVDPAIDLIDEWEVHARDELYDGRLIWVVIAAGDLETVNTVLVDGLFGENIVHGEQRYARSRKNEDNGYTNMSGANDCPVPVAHHDIVSILETIRAGAVANTLLALLELLEQTEVTRDWQTGSAERLGTKANGRTHPLPWWRGG